jgi:nucleoid-associated protein YgaU
MPDRYESTNKSRDKDKNFRKYDSTLYPKIELDDSDIYIITNIGDRLDLLAGKYYNDVNLWWIIAQANHVGKGTLNIVPATQLRIPQNLAKIFTDLETINRNR